MQYYFCVSGQQFEVKPSYCNTRCTNAPAQVIPLSTALLWFGEELMSYIGFKHTFDFRGLVKPLQFDRVCSNFIWF